MARVLETLNPFNGQQGKLYGYLFENPATGLERGLYWNIFIKCAPITYQDEVWEPALLFDWFETRNFASRLLTSDMRLRVEASFYMRWHDPVTSWKLELQLDDRGFPDHISYDLLVDYSGYSGDAQADMRVYGSSPLELTYISIMPDDFAPKPADHSAARELIAPYLPQIHDWATVQQENGAAWPKSATRSFRFSPVR